jgi:hypothetical protein
MAPLLSGHLVLRLQRNFPKVQENMLLYHFCSQFLQEDQVDFIPSPDCSIFIAICIVYEVFDQTKQSPAIVISQ